MKLTTPLGTDALCGCATSPPAEGPLFAVAEAECAASEVGDDVEVTDAASIVDEG